MHKGHLAISESDIVRAWGSICWTFSPLTFAHKLCNEKGLGFQRPDFGS